MSANVKNNQISLLFLSSLTFNLLIEVVTNIDYFFRGFAQCGIINTSCFVGLKIPKIGEIFV